MLGSASLACMLAVAPMGVGAASVPLNSNQHAAPTSAAVAPAASPQPVVTVQNVTPGKFRKSNPYVPSSGKIFFRVTVPENSRSSVLCLGETWKNRYERRQVVQGKTYRLTVMSGDPSDWSLPAVYNCRVASVPRDCDTCGSLSEWTTVLVYATPPSGRT